MEHDLERHGICLTQKTPSNIFVRMTETHNRPPVDHTEDEVGPTVVMSGPSIKICSDPFLRLPYQPQRVNRKSGRRR